MSLWLMRGEGSLSGKIRERDLSLAGRERGIYGISGWSGKIDLSLADQGGGISLWLVKGE